MAEEKNMNQEPFDQDSVMIYIDPKVMSSLTDMAERKQEGLKALQSAAEDGDLEAQYSLGRSYYYGEDGAPKDEEQAFYWFGRAAEGDNIVHFLNQVDEADLLSLIEQEEQAPPVCSCTVKCAAGAVNTACEVCAVNMSECAGPEPEPQEPDKPPEAPATPETPEKKGGNPLIIVALLAVLGAGGTVAYLKFFKKKPNIKGSADLDDYDYGMEDDEDEPEDDDALDEDMEDE